jgi:hypothetical protein
MFRDRILSGIAAILAFAGLAVASANSPARPLSVPLIQQTGSNGPSQLPPPSDAEIHARALKVIANQHRDDEAADQFERIERVSDRTAGANPRTVVDKTYRVVPTGSGTYKILLKDGEKHADPAEYHRQLQQWSEALELAVKTNDSRTKSASEKYQKRIRERAEIVDATNEGFVRKWLGSEVVSGHVCDVVQMDPNPQFHPHSTLQELVTHVSVKLWVDHDSDQIVRGEARVLRDISFGAGVFGKLYRGGVFSLEQAEVAPGIWEPTRKQYDFTARKFLFSFEEHQLTEATHYRHLGQPQQALEVVKNELTTGKNAAGDP